MDSEKLNDEKLNDDFCELTSAEENFLIRLLAETDSLFLPWRVCRDGSGEYTGAWSAWFERIADYRRAGIKQTASRSPATRKASETFTNDLALRGLLNVQVARNVRHVKLPHLVDDAMRAACDLETLADSQEPLRILRLLLLHQKASGHKRPGRVLELDICNQGRPADDPSCVNYDNDRRDEIFQLELDLAPLRSRGVVNSHSDLNSCVGYALTGVVPPSPNSRSRLPEPSDRRFNLYWDHFTATRDDRQLWQPRRTNCIAIPLGAGSWE